MSEAGKIKPPIAGIVIERATRRASAGRNRLIWTNLDQTKNNSKGRQRSHYAKDLGGAETSPTFIMKQKDNSMKMSTSKPNHMWYVDSKASNHMTNHKEWFST